MNQVFLYGACEFAQWTYQRTLEQVKGRTILGFIDGNPIKQGKHFLGLPVVSFDTAVSEYGELFDFLITSSEKTAPDIIGFLLEKGVDPKRILNYEPVEKRLGCVFCETQLIFQFIGNAVSIKICDCISQGGAKRLRPEYNLDPAKLDTESFNAALTHMANLTEQISTGKVPDCCKGCPFIQERYYFKKRKKRHIIWGGAAPCNYKCKDCTNSVLFEKYASVSTLYDDIVRTLNIIEDSGELHEEVTMAFGVGEPTFNPKHIRFLERASAYPFMFFTNGYLYSSAVADWLSKGNAEVYVSLDAGTAVSYRSIKGVDGFEQVKANLRKYAEYGPVVLKYIVFEGINDNEEDFEGFMRFADDVASLVLISRDFYALGELSDHTLRLAAKFIHHYRNNMKLSDIIGFKRRSEPRRLQTYLEELEHGEQ